MRLALSFLVAFVTLTAACRQHSGSALASDDPTVDGINFATVTKIKDQCLSLIIGEDDRNEHAD